MNLKNSGFRRLVIISILFSLISCLQSQQKVNDAKQKYNKHEVYITMRDGVKLFTSYYTPKDTTQNCPILFTRTPYNIEPNGKNNFNYYIGVYSRYVDENYILIFQDVRGQYMSEGTFEDVRPFNPYKKSNRDIDEASDTYDAVDWIIKNVPNNNGRVGVMGISYPGFYSTMAILSGHPAIKAVSPQAPVTDWFIGDDMHHNGAFFLLDCFSFFSSFGQPRHSLSRVGHPRFNYPKEGNFVFFLDSVGPLRNIKKKYLGDSIKFWNNAIKHPNYDDFWKSRNPLKFLKNVKPAVMTVGGWFDAEDLWGALHTYSAIEKQNPSSISNHLVMGPWSHGQWGYGSANNLGRIYWGQDANESYQKLEMQFFEYYLRDKGKMDFPEAFVFLTGANQWKTFDTWPPKNIAEKTLYFQPNGKLSFSLPKGNESYDEYISDPANPVPYSEKVHKNRTREYMTDDQRFVSKRPDVKIYKTDILSADITITGPLTADLFVSTTGTDADYVIKIIDVFPDDTVSPADHKIDIPLAGYQMLVRGEIFRGRYRNSYENPEAFIPGKVAKVKFELPDIAHTFKKGHRVMVQVQNSWFPLVDRNPQKFVDIYQCSEMDFQKATHRIYHDKKRPSNITVRILK